VKQGGLEKIIVLQKREKPKIRGLFYHFIKDKGDIILEIVKYFILRGSSVISSFYYLKANGKPRVWALQEPT